MTPVHDASIRRAAHVEHARVDVLVLDAFRLGHAGVGRFGPVEKLLLQEELRQMRARGQSRDEK